MHKQSPALGSNKETACKVLVDFTQIFLASLYIRIHLPSDLHFYSKYFQIWCLQWGSIKMSFRLLWCIMGDVSITRQRIWGRAINSKGIPNFVFVATLTAKLLWCVSFNVVFI